MVTRCACGKREAMELLSSRRVSLSTLCVYGGGWVRFNWLELLRPELHSFSSGGEGLGDIIIRTDVE